MGGHGGLNILPKKNWNVYNRENRLRVKRDEALAQRQKEDEEKRQAQADRDYRREKLIENKRKRDADAENNPASQPVLVGSQASLQHENFFREQEIAFKQQASERSQKQKLEGAGEQDERFRFARTCKDKSKPWYAKSGTSFDDPPSSSSPSTSLSLPARIRREREEVEANRNRKKKKEKEKEQEGNALTLEALGIKLQQDSCGKAATTEGERSSGQRRKKHKHKHRHGHKKKHASASPPGGPKSMEELRAERLEREQQERRKTLELIARHQKRDFQSGSNRKAFHSSYGYARSKPTDTATKWL